MRSWLREEVDARIETQIDARQVLSVLHHPTQRTLGTDFRFRDAPCLKTRLDPSDSAGPTAADLPIPGPQERMGYGLGSEAACLQSGKRTLDGLRALMRDHQVEVAAGERMLDSGCATGRVLRWFSEEAQRGEAWGSDQHAPSMDWAKANLSPPFRFVTCTSFPHLPFEDNYFTFIYGISVFTHIEYLADTWLMEIRRILRMGGTAIFTVHDEHTIEWFRKNKRPTWMRKDLDLEEAGKHEVTVISGADWSTSFTFLRGDWIRREFGCYFDVLEIRPRLEGYQSAVVLRKR